MIGVRRANLEQAITFYRTALQVYTLETFPERWAMALNNLGRAYTLRIIGEKRANVEQAIACHEEALQVYTLETFPEQWAMIQNNLGQAYTARIVGEKRANVEKALDYFKAALQVYTLETFPEQWAMIQNNLGQAYTARIVGETQKNLVQAIACYEAALQVYSREAFPAEYREIQLNRAFAETQCGNWTNTHEAYMNARYAEEMLTRLSAGVIGRNAVLKESHDAATRDGFALTRLGQAEAAAVAIERGRARWLTDAFMLNTANPELIKDADRRTRYEEAREAFVTAQIALNTSLSQVLTESERRRITLERAQVYYTAKGAFDKVVAEIRAAQDPVDFMEEPGDATTILCAAAVGGEGHALVYLAATPWGGIAVAALNTNPGLGTHNRFLALDLPELTDTLLNGLIETRLNDESQRIIGGFGYAQRGDKFEMIFQDGESETFRAWAIALHEACKAEEQVSKLDEAAQQILNLPRLSWLVDQPRNTTGAADRAILAATLAQLFLQLEMQRCLEKLAEVALRPLVRWLVEQGVVSLTLIPCGRLAAFPLAAAAVADGRTMGEILPTSVAPNACSLLHDESTASQRSGVYALSQVLQWGEAEALTLAKLARNLGLHGQARVQSRATRGWLIEALKKGQVVDVSCAATFDADDFLQSALLLAKKERLTLADALNYVVDLRGLRLLILSAAQTAVMDVWGVTDEVQSLAVGMIQAGARAVLASLWSVDDKATYLLMVRFAQEWFPRINSEPPSLALARAQHWLRTATNRELQRWNSTYLSILPAEEQSEMEALNPWADLVIRETPLRLKALDEHIRAGLARLGGMLDGSFDGDTLVALAGTVGRMKKVRELLSFDRQYNFKRYEAQEAESLVQMEAKRWDNSDVCPFADPIYWAGFQIIGW